jgi:hypothetical protein
MKISLVTCGRCGKPRGLFHTCVTRIGRRRGRTRIRIRATCGSCGRRMGNPLRHVCTTRTDFKRRKARAKRAEQTARRRAKRKAAAAARRERARVRKRARSRRPSPQPRPRHNYQSCSDDTCQRQACQAWRDGRLSGRDEGYDEGYAAAAEKLS